MPAPGTSPTPAPWDAEEDPLCPPEFPQGFRFTSESDVDLRWLFATVWRDGRSLATVRGPVSPVVQSSYREPRAMTKPRTDEIAVVEAMYEIKSSRMEWSRRLARAVASNLGADMGSLVVDSWRVGDGSRTVDAILVDAPPELEEGFAAALSPFRVLQPDIVGLAKRSPLSGFRETFHERHPYRRACTPHLDHAGVTDTAALVTFDTPTRLVAISPCFSGQARLHQTAKRRFSDLSAHLSAALRLRRRLATWHDAGAETDDAHDAVFDADGQCQDAHCSTRDRDLLGALGSAVRRRERARGRLRHEDPDAALRLWNAVVCGRWSLVDRIDRDGRRFVLALENEDLPRDPRALTRRQQQVVRLAGNGAPNSEIAYELGISEACVSSHLHTACRKLKCGSRRDLIRMMKIGNDELGLDLGDAQVRLLVDRVDREDPPPMSARLTLAEQSVLAAIRVGRSNAEIAQQRGTSVRTVANQAASILRKSGRSSRFELMLGALDLEG